MTRVEQIVAWIGSRELVVTKVVLSIATGLSILHLFVPGVIRETFSLVPAFAISHYYVWTFLTSVLLETSALRAIVNLGAITSVSPALERTYGSSSYATFLIVVAAFSTITIFIIHVACFSVTYYEPWIFEPVAGMSGLSAALAVALKQRFPDRPIITSPQAAFLHPVQFQHLPSMIIVAGVCLWAAGLVESAQLSLVLLGIGFAWFFLRFYASDASGNGIVGDLRPEFSFATLLPDILGSRAIIDSALSPVLQAFIRAGLFSAAVKSNATLPFSSDSTSTVGNLYTSLPLSLGGSSGGGASSSSSSNNSNTSDSASNAIAAAAALTSVAGASTSSLYRTDPQMEKRRLMAIKAIDDKLAELSRSATSSGGGASVVDVSSLTKISAAASSNGNGSGTSGARIDHEIVPDVDVDESELARLEQQLAGVQLGGHKGSAAGGGAVGDVSSV